MRSTETVCDPTPIHDDGLISDMDPTFDEIDRSVTPTPPGEPFQLLLVVDELVDEMLSWEEDGAPTEHLEIALELELEPESVDSPAGVSEVA